MMLYDHFPIRAGLVFQPIDKDRDRSGGGQRTKMKFGFYH